ncbi:hypothetical protein ARAM_004233 [Aspergillus rambellii]|uniref:Alcohol acetyltransferase n=1 Tax=Aspergillus rambellii TaxID=308745 RepID=A0A0F8WRK8_9EURO|nr:hypothetical protein ARAM_004233 [Aspergillus rambellii]
MDKLEKLRPVGLLEKFSTARHPLGFYYNVALAASYTLPESFTLPLKDYIYKATETLINQHPILSAIPVDEETNDPYFARLPEIDLSQQILFQKRSVSPTDIDEPDTELQSLLQEQHAIGFKNPLPYWRLLILTDDAKDKPFTAVFVYHHAIGDGGSGKAFHRTFLEALRGAASLKPDEAQQIVASPDTPLLPNLEAAHPLPLSFSYLMKLLFKEKIYTKQDRALWTAATIRSPLTTHLRLIALSAAQTSALLKLCRQNNTTVTCAVQTVIARATFPHLPEEYARVMCSGAISSRKWLPEVINDDSMGVWVQEFAEIYSRNAVTGGSFPWAEAKRSRKTITKELRLKGKNTSVGLLKFVHDFSKYLMEDRLGKPRRASYEVSSLGVVKTENPEDASLPQMGRVIFSQSASVTGSAFEVSVITGPDGCLAMGISWQAEILEDDLMLAVIESLKKELNELCI